MHNTGELQRLSVATCERLESFHHALPYGVVSDGDHHAVQIREALRFPVRPHHPHLASFVLLEHDLSHRASSVEHADHVQVRRVYHVSQHRPAVPASAHARHAEQRHRATGAPSAKGGAPP